jgi:hypothetical protein
MIIIIGILIGIFILSIIIFIYKYNQNPEHSNIIVNNDSSSNVVSNIKSDVTIPSKKDKRSKSSQLKKSKDSQLTQVKSNVTMVSNIQPTSPIITPSGKYTMFVNNTGFNLTSDMYGQVIHTILDDQYDTDSDFYLWQLFPDNTIRNKKGLCLTPYNRNGNNNNVYLNASVWAKECIPNATYQQWVYNSDKRHFQPSLNPQLCLETGNLAILKTCSDNSPTQKWTM